MSNSISRRTFLKCTGASVAALGAASLLGGCQQNGSATIVDVKVGDKLELLIMRTNDQEGTIMLSKKRVDAM